MVFWGQIKIYILNLPAYESGSNTKFKYKYTELNFTGKDLFWKHPFPYL